MNKKGLILVCLIAFACEDSKDTSPPSVAIISPTESSSVSEIALIQCVASDDDSVRIVELWIDSLATGLTDSSKPYEFYWNTVLLSDSTEYSLMAMAEDMSSNISFSPSINILVDNTGSNPKSVNIQSITYNETKMTITIEPSLDNDFLNYNTAEKKISSSGILVTNPPFGFRIKLSENEKKIFIEKLGTVLKKNFSGWTVWILTNEKRFSSIIHLRNGEKFPVFNGDIACNWLSFEMVTGNMKNKYEI